MPLDWQYPPTKVTEGNTEKGELEVFFQDNWSCMR